MAKVKPKPCSKLKPCPFCGGKAKRGLFMGLSTVVCTNCPACVLPVPGEKYEERVKDWNTRKEGKTMIAEVKPVVHAHMVEYDPHLYECSNCGFNMMENFFNYCPNCGAKMDREEDNV